jgi:hypothetical protein
LEARACPGTNVTIGIVDVVSPMGETADIGIGIGNTNPLTVQANASGVASFSECVSVALSGETVRFTLRFTSDDGSGPCDIPFCFTRPRHAAHDGAALGMSFANCLALNTGRTAAR